MKKIYFLLFLQSLIFNPSFGQGGTWTWISGSNVPNDSGVYGMQGIPSENNHPPCEYEPVEWKDKQGNFWIYGGTYPFMSDLWKYNPVTNEWTWVKGNGLQNQPSVYGTQGIANPSNTPGQRPFTAPTWVDTSGAFWLFGGWQSPNDLWKYDIGSNEWTWMKGSDTLNAIGIHGIQGVPSPSNTPGSRFETCSAWTDSLNNLWLFGGIGVDDNGNGGCLNDLMKYDINTNEWTWMKGSAYINAQTNYGIKGVSDTSNDPGARYSHVKWKDVQGNFWLMGGEDENFNFFNDVWKYNLDANEWTWMSGTNVLNSQGNYQSNCVFDTVNIPFSRLEQRSSVTDNCGRFWLFGGFIDDYGDCLNDLWVFDPQLLKWNWISGNNVSNQLGNYGTLGIASPSNIPPSHGGTVAWWGNDNKFYMFGGLATIYDYGDVWVFNPDTNCVPVCGTAAVVPPIADFQVSQAIICAYDCINFTDLSTNAISWQWSFAGALDSTSTTQNPQNICYSKAGIYNVTLIAGNAAGSDTVTFGNYITVTPTPPTPVITQHLDHDTLVCSFDISYYAYQWFYDSTLIAGATDVFLVISKSGNYNVQVTNKNGCSIAGGINIIYGIQNYTNDKMISIYPNPATDELLINGNWKENSNLKLAVINILGQKIYTEEMDSKPLTVNCKPFPTGIYFVQVVNESGQWVGKFIKE